MKLGVGLILTTFGAFWMGEGAGIEWPTGDLFLLILVAVLTLVTFGLIAFMKRTRVQATEEAAIDPGH